MYVLLSIVVLMTLACTATPAPTPDVPLLDEKTVENLTTGFLLENLDGDWRYEECIGWTSTGYATDNINAQYIGKDIWVVEIEPPNICTLTVHDKEARVIQRK